MHGQWQARFDADGTGNAATAPTQAAVTFTPHPETDDALSGRIVRQSAPGGATQSVLAGGIGEGEFGIEQSADGKAITGMWNGDIVVGSCGREIRGTFIDPSDDSERGFVLRRKSSGW